MGLEQSQAELTIFAEFVNISGLRVAPGSVQSCNPPEPDILCEIEGEGLTAFELGEVVGQEFAKYTYERPRLRRRFQEAYSALDKDVRLEIEEQLGGAPAVIVTYPPGTPPGKWHHAVQPILTTLVELRVSLQAGEVPVWNVRRLKNVLSDMEVLLASDGRASLHVAHMTEAVDPTMTLLVSKFKKSYKTELPIELVAYYVSESPRTNPERLSEVSGFIDTGLGRSSFRRVWVLDLLRKRILLVHPPQA